MEVTCDAQALLGSGALHGEPSLRFDQMQGIGAQGQQPAEHHPIERQRSDHVRRQALLPRDPAVPGNEERQAPPQAASPKEIGRHRERRKGVAIQRAMPAAGRQVERDQGDGVAADEPAAMHDCRRLLRRTQRQDRPAQRVERNQDQLRDHLRQTFRFNQKTLRQREAQRRPAKQQQPHQPDFPLRQGAMQCLPYAHGTLVRPYPTILYHMQQADVFRVKP